MLKRDLFPPLNPECARLLPIALEAINRAHPLASRHKTELTQSIKELWKALTSQREDRRGGYLNEPRIRTAYLRYFLPWNLYRLCRLLPGLPLALPPDSAILDLGSGPLTLPIALWIARPELRQREITIFCVDRLPAIMAAGLAILEKLAELEQVPLHWKIVRLKAELTERSFERLGLIMAANVLNEVIENPAWSKLDGGAQAERLAHYMTRQLAPDGQLLLVEPGTVAPASLLSSLRQSLLQQNFSLEAPCPHAAACPMSGRRGESWCHFNFSTAGAPTALAELSEKAGLPKEQASLSFLFASRGPAKAETAASPKVTSGEWLKVRIISEPFKLPPSQIGRYGCSSQGRVLVQTTGRWHDFQPGDYLDVELPAKRKTDHKSGALILDLDSE